MTLNLIRGTMHTNQREASAVAAVDPSAIRDEIRAIASKVQREARNLSRADRQFLADLQRPERYQARWLGRLVQLAARCPSESDAFAIADHLKAFIGAARPKPRLSLVAAIEHETSAQAAADVLEMAAALHPNDPGTLCRCERCLTEHQHALDRLIETVQLRRMMLLGAQPA